MDEYRKRDIADIITRPLRTIQYWTDLKLVEPDIVPPTGKGIARVYSERNMIEFCMIDEMVKTHGVALEIIGTILESLRGGQYGDIKFEDFYTNHTKWGKERELLFVMDYLHKEHIGQRNPEIDIYDIKISKSGIKKLGSVLLMDFVADSSRDGAMIFKLCQIKLNAMKNAGLITLHG